VKSGIIRDRQRFKCKSCSYYFSVDKLGKQIDNYTVIKALQLYIEGVSYREIERLLGISHVSVMNWVKKYNIKTRQDIEELIIYAIYYLIIISIFMLCINYSLIYSNQYYIIIINMIIYILLVSVIRIKLSSVLYYILLTIGYSVILVVIKIYIEVSIMIGNIIDIYLLGIIVVLIN